jgi:hypothetical protein
MRFFAACIAVVLSLSAQPAAEATALGPDGGPGGSPFSETCPGGQYLVGLAAGLGAWVEHVQAICAPWTGTAFAPGTVQPTVHGTSPQTTVDQCTPAASVGGYVETFTRDGHDPKYVNSIMLWCDDVADANGGSVCLETGEGCGLLLDNPDALENCPTGEAAIGINGRSGMWLDAFGLICGPQPKYVPPAPPKPPTVATIDQNAGNSSVRAGSNSAAAFAKGNTNLPATPPLGVPSGAPTTPPPPPSAASASFTVSCQGGGSMAGAAGSDGFIRIQFAPAAQGSGAAAPLPGQCAWSDRAFRPGEPLMLVYPAGSPNATALLQASRSGRFDVHAYNNGQGALVITSIDVTPVPAATGSTNPTGGVVVPQPAGPLAPPAGGPARAVATATVTTAVNIRSGPSGNNPVIGVVRGGTTVAITGCMNGWCALRQLIGIQQGWVAQQFLAFPSAPVTALAPQG